MRHAQLNLGINRIGAEGAAAIGEALKVNGSLTSLNVGDNKIGKEAALELVSIFREKQMTSVGLAGCDLGADGATAVAEYVQLSGSLTSLDVRGYNELDAASKALLRDTVKDRSGFELKDSRHL